jgi:hypothetical protein
MANGRGGKRPGAGRKPGSKNKTTTETGRTLAEMAAEYTQDALNTLAEIMKNEQATATARVAAANSILDRAHGKPLAANVDFDPKDLPVPFTGWAIQRVEPDQRHTH